MITIDVKANLPKYSNSLIVDISTIREKQNLFGKLSPYYPHGGIPIPNTPYSYLSSVNEVWQKLCVKEKDNINNKIMHNNVKFRKGLHINDYWTYVEARREILIPLYCWMLENKAFNIIEDLRKKYSSTTIVIIDQNANCDINNIDAPLSCAFLLKAYIEGKEPYQDVIKNTYNYIMVGRKHIRHPREELTFQKIANIYTDSQRILDF